MDVVKLEGERPLLLQVVDLKRHVGRSTGTVSCRNGRESATRDDHVQALDGRQVDTNDVRLGMGIRYASAVLVEPSPIRLFSHQMGSPRLTKVDDPVAWPAADVEDAVGLGEGREGESAKGVEAEDVLEFFQMCQSAAPGESTHVMLLCGMDEPWRSSSSCK